MEVPVSISSVRKIHIDNIDMASTYADVDQISVCKTCSHSSKRDWKASGFDSFIARLEGKSVDHLLRCEPTQNDITRKAIDTQDFRKVIPHLSASNKRIVAFIDTCGHDILPKCNSCDRFVRETIDIPYADREEILWRLEVVDGVATKVPYTKSGATPKIWKATIGGHCGIGPEGIMVNGVKMHCDPIVRKPNIDPSCQNCAFVDYVGESWYYDHLSVNENARLTPYEYYQATERGKLSDLGPLGEANLALWTKQIRGMGNILTLNANIVGGLSSLDTRETRWWVMYNDKFLVNKLTDVISSFSDNHEILKCDLVAQKMIVMVQDSHLYKRGYTPNLYKYNLIWPPHPQKLDKPESALTDYRIDANCAASKGSMRCSYERNKPCYFHAKRPIKSIVTGEVEFEVGQEPNRYADYPPSAYLHIEQRGDTYFVTDDNNQLPVTYSTDIANATVFRKWMPSLLAQAKRISPKAVADITKQYKEVCADLVRSPHRSKVRPYWLRQSTTEPSLPRCTHPFGLNLRKEFGDTFGLERVDFDFDFGRKNQMEVEEELRVGFRQHEMTPQYLQEEVLTNMSLDPKYRQELGGNLDPYEDIGDTDDFKVIDLGVSGGYASTSDLVGALDDLVEAGDADPDDKTSTAKRYVTKRQQMFGYALSNGTFGKRRGDKTRLFAQDPDYVIFEHNYESTLDNLAWICMSCEKAHGFVDVDLMDLKCVECGGDLYRNHSTREVTNPRAKGGIGNAYVKASDAMQSVERLRSTVCDRWVFGANHEITYASIVGAVGVYVKRNEQSIHASIEATPIEIIKVGVLTPEQIEVNKAYDRLLSENISKREAHMQAYPKTTPAELQRLFPTPKGKVYQERAAGSLSKMGGQ